MNISELNQFNDLLPVGSLAQLVERFTGIVEVKGCSVAVVSSVAVWSSHVSTNRMAFYFFQSAL